MYNEHLDTYSLYITQVHCTIYMYIEYYTCRLYIIQIHCTLHMYIINVDTCTCIYFTGHDMIYSIIIKYRLV